MIESNVMDVLITTPGRIATILRTKNSGNLDLTNVQSIVLDEVDILLIDENFGPQLRTVGAATASSSSTQFVFVASETCSDAVLRGSRRTAGVCVGAEAGVGHGTFLPLSFSA